MTAVPPQPGPTPEPSQAAYNVLRTEPQRVGSRLVSYACDALVDRLFAFLASEAGRADRDAINHTAGDTYEPGDGLQLIEAWVCDPCLDAQGGECHTPGCAFWMSYAPVGKQRAWLQSHLRRRPPEGTAK